MRFLDELKTQEKKNDTVACRSQGLDWILYCGVTFLTDILEAISFDSDTISNDANDSRPMEKLFAKKRKEGWGEVDQRLN